MRILVVCTDAEIGGAERFVATLAASKRPGDVVALAVLMQPNEMDQSFQESFDEVFYLGFSGSSRNIFGMIRKLNSVCVNFKPDVISSHLFHADLITALLPNSIPKTTSVHTQAFGEGVHPLTKMIAGMVGRLSRRFSAVIPVSSGAAMKEFIRKLRYKNVVTPISNGAYVPAEPPFDPASRTFLSLARFHPVKGHRELFQAFSILNNNDPSWSLAAYGAGVTNEHPEMVKLISDLGLETLIESGKLMLNGVTHRPQETLKSAAALIISSTYGEAFPIVGAEAAGAGVPVISTDLGSCHEFVDDERFLVQPGNVEELARAMQEYASLNDEERMQLSRLARKRAETTYDPAQVYERYRAVWERAMNR